MNTEHIDIGLALLMSSFITIATTLVMRKVAAVIQNTW